MNYLSWMEQKSGKQGEPVTLGRAVEVARRVRRAKVAFMLAAEWSGR